MKKTVTVEVRREHLERAIDARRSQLNYGCNCLVARAMKDAGLDVWCRPASWHFRGLPGGHFPFPSIAVSLIHDFDRGDKDADILACLPLSFDVEVEVQP